MDMDEQNNDGKAVLQSFDVVASILTHLSSPRDFLTAAAVCRVWRMATMNHTHIRSWTLDDTLEQIPGLKTSSAPLMAKTPPPKQWVNPTAYSPLAAFKMPKSLLPSDRSYNLSTPPTCKLLNRFQHEAHGDTCISPRTPSPIREIANCPPLLDIVKNKMVMGMFLGDVDIMSPRMNDDCMQLLLKKCPRLHTFRLVHTCASRLVDDPASFSSIVDSEGLHQVSCSCSLLSNTAFAGIHAHCPDLISLTLILQHVTFRKMLRKLFVEFGRLPKLQTLSMELRVPSFGQSTKSKLIWESHVRVTDQEIFALIQAGPPPLSALALNRCDLTGTVILALANACPNIEALELQSEFEDTKEHDFLQRVPLSLMGLASLSAAAFGVLLNMETCKFDEWRMPALKRLRLETRDALSVQQLQLLKSVCPELESVHLIWTSNYGMRETHLYPFEAESLSMYPGTVIQ